MGTSHGIGKTRLRDFILFYFSPSMNLLLTGGLISSKDTISYTGLNVVNLIDFSSVM